MHSFNVRYITKITSRIISLLLGLVTASLVPRSLGNHAYGVYGYLENFYSNLQGFLDVGTSTCYFNKLSREQKNNKIILFYIRLLLVLLSLAFIFIFGINISGLNKIIFPDISNTKYIYMGFILMCLMFVSQVSTKTIDALGITVKNELFTVIIKLIFASSILTLYLFQHLHLSLYYYALFTQFLLLILSAVTIFLKSKLFIFNSDFFTFHYFDFKKIGKEFWNYSNPLLFFAIFIFIVMTIDRWFLQKISGSFDQSMFTLAFKISQLSMLFTSSIIPLLQREYSIAFGNHDKEKILSLVKKYGNLMFIIASYFSLFVAFNSESIVKIFGGVDFEKARIPLLIMAFYPVHQCYGQVIGSLFYSTDNTRLYRNIGIVTNSFGLIVSFFLLAPAHWGGLHLGAIGLAIKMVSIQLISVNILLFYAFKLLKGSYLENLKFQLKIVLLFLILAFVINFLKIRILDSSIVSFFISGFVYTVLTVFLFLKFPQVFDINKETNKKLLIKLKLMKK